MQLSEEDILKYKALYHKHFGGSISDEEALDQAQYLIHFVSLIAELPPKGLDPKVAAKGKIDLIDSNP